MSESYLYLASSFFPELFLAPLHTASPISRPSSRSCPLTHSCPSRPRDHAAGVALQPSLPHRSGIPSLQPNSSSRFSPLHVYARINLHLPLNPTALFSSPWGSFLSCPHWDCHRQHEHLGLFHFQVSFLFNSIPNVFHSLFACKVAVANLFAALQLHSTHVHILSVYINVCLHLRKMYTTPNTVISTIFLQHWVIHWHHITLARQDSNIFNNTAVLLQPPSHSSAAKVKWGTDWTLPSFFLAT